MTQRWQNTKAPSAPNLGVMVDQTDSTINTVTIFDLPTGMPFFRVRSLYGLHVETLAPPPTETKHRLSGLLCGVPMSQDFDHDFEAQERLRSLERSVRDGEDCDLKISEVQVVVEG
jgi:hypothetical protein